MVKIEFKPRSHTCQSLFISLCHSPTTITRKNLVINHLSWVFLFITGSPCLLSASRTSSKYCHCQAVDVWRLQMSESDEHSETLQVIVTRLVLSNGKEMLFSIILFHFSKWISKESCFCPNFTRFF